mgnify:CR=1 FL=1
MAGHTIAGAIIRAAAPAITAVLDDDDLVGKGGYDKHPPVFLTAGLSFFHKKGRVE